MSRLVVVSNRLDLPPADAAPGGLAVSLAATLRHTDSLWFGWSGHVDADSPAPRRVLRNGLEYAIVGLSAAEHRDYYHGFCNGVLWPLSHGQDVPRQAHEAAWFHVYLQVNARMANQLLPLLRADDSVWVQDYHLLPMGHYLRQAGYAGPLGHFLHVPCPALDRCGPGSELLDTLLAYDLLGFQTAPDLALFQDQARRRWGPDAVDHSGITGPRGRRCATGVFPLGIDVDAVRDMASAMRARAEVRWWSPHGDAPRIIGADRLDASKGLPQRLQAFRQLLAEWPMQHAWPDYLQLVTPSRLELPAQRQLQDFLRRDSQALADSAAAIARQPPRWVFGAVAHAELMGMLSGADIGLVTPLRDGMNLLAKEFVAAQPADDPGVLVLSRGAGAALELPAALQVEPADPRSIANALREALRMSVPERRARHRDLLDCLRENALPLWRYRFMKRLSQAHQEGVAAGRMDNQ